MSDPVSSPQFTGSEDAPRLSEPAVSRASESIYHALDIKSFFDTKHEFLQFLARNRIHRVRVVGQRKDKGV